MARPPVYRRDYYGTRRPLLLNKTHTEKDRETITVRGNTLSALQNYQDHACHVSQVFARVED